MLPGATASATRCTAVDIVPHCSTEASATNAIDPGTIVSTTWNAMARLWLNPSA